MSAYAAIGNGKNMIILENLRSQKIKMWDKAKVSTIENVRLVMNELGKLHALSFAPKDQKPNEFAKIFLFRN